jgi:hypothetical protein
MKKGMFGNNVETTRADEVNREPVMYVTRNPNLFAKTAAKGIVIKTDPHSNDPTNDIMPVPSPNWIFSSGSITPNDMVMAPLIKFPTKHATHTNHPHPPSGGPSEFVVGGIKLFRNIIK